MKKFLQAVINGVTLGGFYGAMVLGFSVIWGVMGFINLAESSLGRDGLILTSCPTRIFPFLITALLVLSWTSTTSTVPTTWSPLMTIPNCPGTTPWMRPMSRC